MENNIYGVTSNNQATDNNLHTYILVNDNDNKKFYDEKTTVVTTTNEDASWGGSFVLGQSITQPTENSEFEVSEAIAFDKVLTETQIFDVYDKIFA